MPEAQPGKQAYQHYASQSLQLSRYIHSGLHYCVGSKPSAPRPHTLAIRTVYSRMLKLLNSESCVYSPALPYPL